MEYLDWKAKVSALVDDYITSNKTFADAVDASVRTSLKLDELYPHSPHHYASYGRIPSEMHAEFKRAADAIMQQARVPTDATWFHHLTYTVQRQNLPSCQSSMPEYLRLSRWRRHELPRTHGRPRVLPLTKRTDCGIISYGYERRPKIQPVAV